MSSIKEKKKSKIYASIENPVFNVVVVVMDLLFVSPVLSMYILVLCR